MSDILGIASNAVAAYQRALSTTSNNIANVSTPGYTRETANFEANPVTQVGNIFMGTGASVDKITRQYNAFLDANLRNSNSDLSSQTPMVDYANRVVDIMGGDSTSLNSQLDQFFTSARGLSADPASTVLRSSFVRDAQGIADRFAQLSGQLDSIQAETTQALQGQVDQVNSLTKQLALINFQLNKQRTADAQPAGLMDQRDQLLLKLSDLTRVNTKFELNGTVTVSLGPSITQDIVVSGNNSTEIGANFSAAAPEKVALVLDPFGKAVALNGPNSGSIAGLMAFREQVLGSSHAALDNLATTFAGAVNDVHKGGIDGYGNPAGVLFNFDSSAANAAGGMRVAFDDPLRVSAAAQFRVTKTDTNTSAADPTLVYAPGTYNNGVVGGAGTAVRADDVTKVFVNNSDPSAGHSVVVSSQVPVQQIASVAAGLQDVSFFLDSAQTGQNLNILTRDGRAVVGSSLTQAAQTAMLSPGNGFVPGATYSDTYLNQSGSPDGYRGIQVFYGAQAQVLPQPLYNDKDQITGFNPSAPLLEGNRIVTGQTNPIAGDAFLLNGVALAPGLGPADFSNGQTLQANDLANWINTQTYVDPQALSSVIVNGTMQPSPSDGGTLSIPLSNTASGIADSLGNELSQLDINGTTIDFSSVRDLNALVAAINDPQKALSGTVFASISQTFVKPDALKGGVLINGSTVYPTDSTRLTFPIQQDSNGSITVGGKTLAYLLTQSLKIGGQTINTVGVTQLDDPDHDPSEGLIQRINSKQSSTSVTASISDGKLVLSPLLASGPFLLLNAQPKTGVTATAHNEIRIPPAQLNLKMPLSINGQSMQLEDIQPRNSYELAATINAQSGVTNVTASVSDHGELVLTNALGHEGEDITIDRTLFGGRVVNALGAMVGTYGGSLSLTQPVSSTSFIDPLALTKPVMVNGIKQSTDSAANIAMTLAVTTADGDSSPKIGGVAVKGMSFSIAGHPINTADITTLSGLVSEINRSTSLTKVTATVSATGALVLSPAVAYKPLQLTFGASGSPHDLAALGFRTQATISGASPDDLLVFVSGSGSASVSASFAGQPADPRAGLRAQTLKVYFDTATHYTITDTTTGTQVASRSFDPAKLDPGLDYQGLQLKFTSAPAAGDSFTMDGNQDGLGNNDNMVAIAHLETKSLVGNKTLSGAYIDQVNEMGNISRQAKTAQTALTVVHDQAVTSRDQISGVSLDAEAADLIRFQQAYQAAAKVIQISGTLFDAMIGIR